MADIDSGTTSIEPKALRALAEDAQRFRDMATYLPVAVWTLEVPEKRVTYVSPAYSQIWGCTLGSLEEAYPLFIGSIHPDDRETFLRRIYEETAGGVDTEIEYRIVKRDNTVRWIRSRAVPVYDDSGQMVRLFGCAEDITTRKLAEKRLSEAQRRLRALLDIVPDGVSLKDVEGHYLEVNRPYAQRWGMQPQDFVGKTAFDIFPEQVAFDTTAEDLEVMRSGIELRNDRQGPIRDRECWLEVIKAPIVNEANQTIGIACISRDISTAKLLEAERVRRDVRLRESLVKEVHQRIKNTLQGVLPIIGQLALDRPEHRDVVDAVIARVSTIADVHGLYGTLGESGHYLDQILLTLVSSLKVLHADFPLDLTINASPNRTKVVASEIVPLALIVNELIMNAIKHADRDRVGGTIGIVLDCGGGCASITISNHSGRFPAHFDFDAELGLGTGLTLVKSLLPPVGATLRFDNGASLARASVELTLTSPLIVSILGRD